MAALSPCETLCVQHCALLPARNVSLRVTEVMQCLIYQCAMLVTYNQTGEIVDQVDTVFAHHDHPSLLTSTPQENCTMQDRAFRLDVGLSTRYTVPVFGYLSPIIVLVTVINNLLVCIVLLKPHMRSPTNAILVAMAVTDMFTGLFPVPVFLYFYSTERVHEWVPYEWCRVVNVFVQHIPTIFHTASIWLTMSLALQRYIYVCHSIKAKAWCTMRNVRNVTVAIYVVATLSQISRFVEDYPVETLRISSLNPHEIVSTCVVEYRPWFKRNMDLYFNMYYWFRVIFIHLIPCVSLVVINALLIYAMHVAQRRRRQLLRQNKKSESRKIKESNGTTLMLVAVVGLLLLVEFPLGMLMVLLIIDQTFGVVLMPSDVLHAWSLFSNFLILLSYPLNFFIYCGMSKQFRDTFKLLFTRADSVTEREYARYRTLPTENGKHQVTETQKTAPSQC